MLHPGWQRRDRRIVIEGGWRQWLSDRQAKAVIVTRWVLVTRSVLLMQWLVGVGRILMARLRNHIGSANSSERVGLTDQPCQLSKGITLAWRMLVRVVIRVVRRERSVLISVRHRDVASPSG
ncbi:hypothetical protein [Rhodopseudomonas sp. BAL398]|uniref:hypothetical protein n=1 Tax=Rhodopseudomonas TaxID=1073 RepID=UPI00294ADD36|nr:hypothetical protein [Rhodopseudomonas sp. BAL398]WOK19079.1 hypothetical protein RBJ75_06045 [Rhodopseudomonas sp. BAL398]